MNSKKNIAIEAATDGACSGNPGPGGWGGLIIFSDNSERDFNDSRISSVFAVIFLIDN